MTQRWKLLRPNFNKMRPSLNKMRPLLKKLRPSPNKLRPKLKTLKLGLEVVLEQSQTKKHWSLNKGMKSRKSVESAITQLPRTRI